MGSQRAALDEHLPADRAGSRNRWYRLARCIDCDDGDIIIEPLDSLPAARRCRDRRLACQPRRVRTLRGKLQHMIGSCNHAGAHLQHRAQPGHPLARLRRWPSARAPPSRPQSLGASSGRLHGAQRASWSSIGHDPGSTCGATASPSGGYGDALHSDHPGVRCLDGLCDVDDDCQQCWHGSHGYRVRLDHHGTISLLGAEFGRSRSLRGCQERLAAMRQVALVPKRAALAIKGTRLMVVMLGLCGVVNACGQGFLPADENGAGAGAFFPLATLHPGCVPVPAPRGKRERHNTLP